MNQPYDYFFDAENDSQSHRRSRRPGRRDARLGRQRICEE